MSEVVKHGLRDEEREGTCSKCMVISVEEVMESGHFYGWQDLPPEPLQAVNMLILFPFSPTCFSKECVLERGCVKRADVFFDIIKKKKRKSSTELRFSRALRKDTPQ